MASWPIFCLTATALLFTSQPILADQFDYPPGPKPVAEVVQKRLAWRHLRVFAEGVLVWENGQASVHSGSFGEPGYSVCLNVRFKEQATFAVQRPRNGLRAAIRGTLEEYDCGGAAGALNKECLLRCSDWLLDQAVLVAD